MRLPRFHRFRSRLLLLLLGLIALVQAAVFFFVAHANRANALAHIRQNLDLGARAFERVIDERGSELIRAAGLLSGDYAFRQVFASDDRPTIRSALDNYRQRIGASMMVLLQPDGTPIADTRPRDRAEDSAPFKILIGKAAAADSGTARGFSELDGKLQVLMIVPLYAPQPNLVAWIGLAFPIDRAFAGDLKASTQLDATFLAAGAQSWRAMASTLPPAQAAAVAARAGAAEPDALIPLGGEPYVTTFRELPMLAGSGRARIALQRSLNAELAPARQLESALLTISLAGLAVACLLGGWLARSVSQPVQALAEHTAVIAAGDYTRRLGLRRADEFGQLASAFNRMSEGLAERDRARDLLGKVVSPEIAAQLLRAGVVLGGEEREVTILFSDLRNFTALSETLPPAAVLALLNRYLDRMSAVVEAHGGVIDKYIGDALMALFGAPLADPAAADHALDAALAMDASLRAFNAELAAEGRPPLTFGIGLNTARVVAGNMGSRRRLNYTVIGDGVNVAARLEELTKTPAYRARILVGEATLRAAQTPRAVRPLGEVSVKGRAEPVRIFALDPPA